MTRPRLLDLYSGEGGAGEGYHRAGFDVTGVDRANHAARYPHRFIRSEALRYLAAHGRDYDVIHASPPCQFHSASTYRNQGRVDTTPEMFDIERHVDLIPATRELLIATGRPWVMENVPGAKLRDPLILCGSMFGLGADCRDGWRQLRRHREFESTQRLIAPSVCAHKGLAVSVYGHGGGISTAKGYAALLDEAREAIGTPWMSRRGVSEAIPPAFTEHIGLQLIAQIERAAA